MRHCSGAALIGLPRWTFDAGHELAHLPTEFSHYEGALARALGLPLLVLAEENLMRRVVFDSSFGPYIGEFPQGADSSWLRTNEFDVPFEYWRRHLEVRRDVFLGYCGAASTLADRVLRFLEDDVGATVLDWQRDFAPGRSILEEIEEARVRCTTGVFLFTKDDGLSDTASGNAASPRDNVVFEAGYFVSGKGKKRVLIIRESGTKMPADLGGDIYASLADKGNIAPIERTLAAFMGAI
jgi:predicted nucleotide-binding protein with TIR-like domain